DAPIILTVGSATARDDGNGVVFTLLAASQSGGVRDSDFGTCFFKECSRCFNFFWGGHNPLLLWGCALALTHNTLGCGSVQSPTIAASVRRHPIATSH